MHKPPVQSDRCALSGNYQLESNPERHDKTPLAAAISNRSAREDRLRGLEVEAWLRLHWKNSFGNGGLVNPVTGLSSSPTDLTFEQTASPGGFFVYRARDYDSLKRISRRSFVDYYQLIFRTWHQSLLITVKPLRNRFPSYWWLAAPKKQKR